MGRSHTKKNRHQKRRRRQAELERLGHAGRERERHLRWRITLGERLAREAEEQYFRTTRDR